MSLLALRRGLLATLVLTTAAACHATLWLEVARHPPDLRAYGPHADQWNGLAVGALQLGIAVALGRRALLDRRMNVVRPYSHPWAGLIQRTLALFLLATGALAAWHLPITAAGEASEVLAASLAAGGGLAGRRLAEPREAFRAQNPDSV